MNIKAEMLFVPVHNWSMRNFNCRRYKTTFSYSILFVCVKSLNTTVLTDSHSALEIRFTVITFGQRLEGKSGLKYCRAKG